MNVRRRRKGFAQTFAAVLPQETKHSAILQRSAAAPFQPPTVISQPSNSTDWPPPVSGSRSLRSSTGSFGVSLAQLALKAVLRLLLFAQEAVTAGKRVKIRAHETAERVLGGADDRLAANVEARV